MHAPYNRTSIRNRYKICNWPEAFEAGDKIHGIDRGACLLWCGYSSQGIFEKLWGTSSNRQALWLNRCRSSGSDGELKKINRFFLWSLKKTLMQ